MPSADAPIWTIAALLQWTAKHFAEKGIETPRLDAQVLLAHALGWKRSDLYVRYEYEPTDAERAPFRALVTKRAAGSPVAYLVGYKEFFLHRFEVTPDVLIPRPSTESLVITALDLLKNHSHPHLLDIGTGSGAIAISIAAKIKQARGTAVDISEAAIAVARRNAERIGVSDRVSFIQGDLFDSLPIGQSYDLIVSNPPYIPSGDIAHLDIGVRDFEPLVAIDGGVDGFCVVERILNQAASYMKPHGVLLLEVGIKQAPIVMKMAQAARWHDVKSINDAEGIPRVVVMRSEPEA